MSVSVLFQAGRLSETIAALGADLRNDPTNVRQRTFLFELLCFAGEYDRAEKHLELLAGGSREAELGAWLYRSALHAERVRQGLFREGGLPAPEAPPVPATVNGHRFGAVSDVDPRLGARLEVYAAGQYTLIPFAQLASVRFEPPKQLRDLLWARATVQTGAEWQGLELGEVLVPVLAPLSWRHPEEAVRLGRVTDWEEGEDGAVYPIGQKLLVADEVEIPLLELRTLEFGAADPD